MEAILTLGALAGLALLIYLFRMRERFYTRRGKVAPSRYSRGGAPLDGNDESRPEA